MGVIPDGIDARLKAFLEAQPLFFVATAPLSGDGHINLSPKGLHGLRVLAPDAVAYLDLTGSGVETAAHLRENGRIVLMCCAFEGPPRIVRLHGRGEVVEAGAPGFADLAARWPADPAARAVVRVGVDRVADSCGFGVPLMRFVGERDQLPAWAARKGEAGLAEYRAAKNAASIDGLQGLPPARRPGYPPG